MVFQSLLKVGQAKILSVNALKKEILTPSRQVERGVSETDEERTCILGLFEALEKKNPTKRPLTSPLVKDLWTLEYTTSDSILIRGGFPMVGPTLQRIDTVALTAENSETVSCFGVPVSRKVTAELRPVDAR